MKTKITDTTDQELIERIQARIRWDIRVSNSDITIHAKHGIITLNGYFDEPYRHAAAVSAIVNTDGVVGLNDKSQVIEDYFRTDNELEVLITKQVLSLVLMPGEWIDVQVCDGVVKLEGLVFRPRLKAFADRASWELSGVKDCINMINIRESADELRHSRAVFRMSSEPSPLNI